MSFQKNKLPKEYAELVGKNAGHCKEIPVTPEEDLYFKELKREPEERDEEWFTLMLDLHR